MTKLDRDRRHDAKRRFDKPWRNLYKTRRWHRIRDAQLTAHPLCARHLAKGEHVRAEVVHHVDRHEGDPTKFWSGPFESLCAHCHNSTEQQSERYGYSLEIGADGWPSDPRHPQNRT